MPVLRTPSRSARLVSAWAAVSSRLMRCGGAGSGEDFRGRRAVVGAAGSPQGGDGAIDQDRIAAELAGVLFWSAQVLTADYGASVDGDGARRVHPPPGGPTNTEPTVELSRRVRQHDTFPAEVAGDGVEPVDRAESNGDEPNALVVMRVVHLHQVLLTGQSVTVA